jgi:hypothetical protein
MFIWPSVGLAIFFSATVVGVFMLNAGVGGCQLRCENFRAKRSYP